MSAHATSCFYGEYTFCGDAPSPADPGRDRRLPNTDPFTQLSLIPDRANRPFKGLSLFHNADVTTGGGYPSTCQSGKAFPQTRPVPKTVKPSALWERFEGALKDLPRYRPMNQTALGRALGVGQQMVSEIRRGTKNPSYDVYVAMAKYAEMSVEYLLTGRGPQRPWMDVDPTFHRVLQIWEALDDANRAKLKERAEELFDLQGRRRRKPRWEDEPEMTGSHKLPKDPSH